MMRYSRLGASKKRACTKRSERKAREKTPARKFSSHLRPAWLILRSSRFEKGKDIMNSLPFAIFVAFVMIATRAPAVTNNLKIIFYHIFYNLFLCLSFSLSFSLYIVFFNVYIKFYFCFLSFLHAQCTGKDLDNDIVIVQLYYTRVELFLPAFYLHGSPFTFLHVRYV